MALLGFLILVAVALIISAIVLRGSDSVRIDLEWFTVNTDAWAVFAAGAVTVLMLGIGCWLLAAGLKRSRKRRAEMRALRDRADAKENAAAQPAAGTDTAATPGSAKSPDDHFDSTPRER